MANDDLGNTLTGDDSLEFREFTDPPVDPIPLLKSWFEQAEQADFSEPMAMVLATSGADGAPSTRIVLVKRTDGSGVLFGTHSGSRKGREFSESASAAGTFYWRETMQQVNLAGTIEELEPELSDELFDRRTDLSKAATRASRQSELLESVDGLRADIDADLAAGDLSRPENWAGYRLKIDRVEFWHGSRDRIHRRLEYSLGPDGWSSRRLQP